MPGVRDSGTGFCVGRDAQAARILTCAHVVTELESTLQGQSLCANGRPASNPLVAADGLDAALLTVPGLAMEVLELAEGEPSVGSKFTGFGYVHLHGERYVTTPLRGSITDFLTVREQLSQAGAPGLLLSADEGIAFSPGNSGSALIDDDGKVVGVLAYASHDGRKGYALAASALRNFVAESGAPGQAQTDAGRPTAPALPAVTDPDDPQKGRFGGHSRDAEAELVPSLGKQAKTHFRFDLSVRPRGGAKLEPPARFFLHDTFPRPLIQITRKDTDGAMTLRDVHSYGVFTIGCQVLADGVWHSLEYDLKNLEGLEPEFKNR